MKLRTGMAAVAVACALMTMGACSSDDEVLAAKDQSIKESADENARLKRELADAQAVRMVDQKLAAQRQAESDRARAEAAKAAETPPPAVVSDDTSTPKEKPVGGRTPESVVKIKDPDIEVETRGAGDVVMRLNSKELFTPGSADLTPGGQKVLTKVADNLRKYPDFRISVEGHTDDTPLKKTAGRWKSNLNLSIARAISVRQYLNQKGKVSDDRMRVVGYGETRPLVPNKDESARSKNRRVEVVLYK